MSKLVQDIYPHLFRNEYTNKPPEAGDFVLAFSQDSLLMDCTDGIRLPTVGELGVKRLQFLFTVDGRGYYLAEEPPSKAGGFSYAASRAYRGLGPAETRFACAVGGSLRRWYEANRFCGGCGAEMGRSGQERALVCPNCGQTVYPKICPAVIVAICDGERLLLTKYAGRGLQYALVAGFAEIGEGIEDTVRREVQEEVGLRVGDLRFYKSQPWVFTDTLLFGFFVRLEGSGQIRLQEEELSMAEWFQRDALPRDHSGISLTGEMIELFRAGEDPFSKM